MQWGWVYLVSDTRLSEEERKSLMIEAIRMYQTGKERKKVRGERYEGVISTSGRHELIGTFDGQHFDAELDTDHGKSKLSFLVAEKIRAELN